MSTHRAQAVYASPARQDESDLIRRYGPLIDRCARRIALRSGDPNLADELWTAGALGLLDAARRYDQARAVKFETFAEHRIRGAMLDELRRTDHLPRRLRGQADELARARNRLGQQHGREPSPEELAHALGVDLDALAALEQVAQAPVPLTPELPELFYEADADERLDRGLLAARLARAIAALPERLQTLMQLHYGEEFTYKEIAQIFGVSEPRVCQLHAEAVKHLRAAMAQESK